MGARVSVCVLTVFGLVQGLVRGQSPTITNQPASRRVWTNCTVSFLVSALDDAALSYQWQFNGTNLSNSIITTVAGNGMMGFSGDGGAATSARLETLLAISVDNADNLYLPDSNQQRLRRVDPSGIIRTIAGGGTNGLGDGGAATNATLHSPGSVAVDSFGNVFIPDLANQRIRKVDTNGIISTVAGTGTGGYSGDGGPATNASLSNPSGVAIDTSGNLFIADQSNRRIRMVDTNSIISTVAGNGTFGYSGDGGPATNASFYGPYRLAVSSSGKVFFIDGPRVRGVDADGVITTVAGNGANSYSGDGGAATNASLNQPKGVAVDGDGNVYIADTGNGRIRQVSTNGIITTVAGGRVTDPLGDGGPATNAWLSAPYCVAVDRAGNLFISDANNFRVRKVTNTRGSTLTLNNVGIANAGNYQVVVVGNGGSVTSVPAALTVASSPLVCGVVPLTDGSLTVDFVSAPNSTNVVLCTSNVLPPVLWEPLATNVAGADGDWRYSDTNAGRISARFYRSAEVLGP